ncbi:MAG: type II toxin-antitoxin system HicB family antitoxin [Ignavibacteriae bacterium]|nr:type II toxin-antitoxin system HicB family antitoxin [Ignavibacteriota bacterium]
MYVAYAEELPGANTQGKTIEEVKINLKEAIELVIEANKELAKKTFRRKKLFREKIFVSL